MLEHVQAVDRRRVRRVFFITLTVPAADASWDAIEDQRRKWVKRLKRLCDGAVGPRAWSLLWRKEAHPGSGNPHIHALLVFNDATPARRVPKLGAFRHWNDAAWADSVASDDERHRDVGCRVELMKSYAGVVYYCGKYVAKPDDTEHPTKGRIWGIANRKGWPAKRRVISLDSLTGARVRRGLRKWSERRRATFELSQTHDADLKPLPPGLVKWDRIYPDRIKRGRVRYRKSMDETLARMSSLMRTIGTKQRIRRRLARVGFNVLRRVWSQDGDTGKLEHTGDERQHVQPGLMFLPWADVVRIMAYARSLPARNDSLGWSVRPQAPF